MYSLPALSYSEQMSLFDALNSNVMIVNERFAIEMASTGMLDILKKPISQVVGKKCSFFFKGKNSCIDNADDQEHIKSSITDKKEKIRFGNRNYYLKCAALDTNNSKYLVVLEEIEYKKPRIPKINTKPFINEYGIFLKAYKEVPVALSFIKVSDENEFTLTSFNDRFRKLFNINRKKRFSDVFESFPIEWLVDNISDTSYEGYSEYKNYYYKEYNMYLHLYFSILSSELILLTVVDSTKEMETQRSIVNILYDTIEKERERFARDLHDSLGSLLSTISMRIKVLKSGKLNDDKVIDILAQTGELVDMAVSSARDIAYNIKPYELKDSDFQIALISYIEKIGKTADIEIVYDRNDFSINLTQNQGTNLFRIIAELVNNTLKHSGASNIRLKMKEKNNRFYFEYHDNGVGFDISEIRYKKNPGMGVGNIKHRSHEMKGACRFISEKGRGMTFNLIF